MKNTIICFLAFILSIESSGQDRQVNCYDSLSEFEQVKLSKEHFKQIVNEEFGNIIGSHSRTNIGNFAALDLNKTKVDFTGNILFKNSSLLALNANGGVSDGSLSIFTNQKLNSELGMEVEYFFISKASLQYDYKTLLQYNRRKEKLIDDSNLELIKLSTGYKADSLRREIQDLERKRRILILDRHLENVKKEEGYYESFNLLEIEALNRKRSTLNSVLIPGERNPLKKDSLQFEIEKVNAEISGLAAKDSNDYYMESLLKMEEIQYEIALIDTLLVRNSKKLCLLNDTNIRYRMEDEIIISRNKKLKSLQANKENSGIKTYGFTIRWFSIGYGLNTQIFHLFTPGLPFNEQVAEYSYASHNFSIQYSLYHLSPASFNSFFGTAGISFGIGNNLSSLSKIEITERANFGTNPDDRYSTKKYEAYSGDYKQDLSSVRFFLDFFWFLFEDNIGAVHIFPAVSLKDEHNTSLNFGTGLLISFLSKDNMSTSTNMELYINLKDLSNANNSPGKLYNRSEVGLRFSFPITFKSI